MRRNIENLVVAVAFCATLLIGACTDGREATLLGPGPGELLPGAPANGGDEADDREDASERKPKSDEDDNGLRI